MEDRSALFNQLKNFSQRKLKKVETKVVTASGEQLVEKRGAKGLQVLTGGADGNRDEENQPPRKLDLQVGLVLPGFLIGSQDVAHDKSSLDSYGVTHVLNLDSEIENKFEDDYNYKNINIQDRPDFELEKVIEECFDFIDDGRHYGNVLVHCSGTVGLSRSTAICIAYLMNKEKQSFDVAFNNVKEARSFVRPNEGFVKQLKDYDVKLRGAQQAKESGIDDPFALRKKQEIEQEKAMVAGAASVKNRMKMFGATLDTGPPASRSKSVSPSPMKPPPSSGTSANTSSSGGSTAAASKWAPASKTDSSTSSSNNNNQRQISKSMTPEPRKSNWTGGAPPPPPPPPMPTGSPLLANDKQQSTGPTRKSQPPPPPPPPPPAGDLLRGAQQQQQQPAAKPSQTVVNKFASSNLSSRNSDESSSKQPSNDSTTQKSNETTTSGLVSKQRMVFGRVPPPAMKLRAGVSVEKHDSAADKNIALTSGGGGGSSSTSKPSQSKGSLQLPLKRQFTSDSGGENEPQAERAPSPSAALRAAKQQAAAKQAGHHDDQPKTHSSGLNRSSTKKLLNLIKTKTKSDLTLPDGDENDEIEALLGALESESIDNIDWDELGLDEDEVKNIIEQGGQSSSSSSSSSSSESEEEDDEEEEIEEEVETSTQHFYFRGK